MKKIKKIIMKVIMNITMKIIMKTIKIIIMKIIKKFKRYKSQTFKINKIKMKKMINKFIFRS